MACRIVDHLELIEIDIKQGISGFVTCRELNNVFELLFEVMPVIEAGEGIMLRQVFQLPTRQLVTGDITKHQHHTMHHAAAITDRRGRILNHIFRTISGYQGRVIGQPDNVSLRQTTCNRTHSRLAGHFIYDIKYLVDGFTAGNRYAPAGQGLRNRIKIFHFPGITGGDHGITDTVQGHQASSRSFSNALRLASSLRKVICCFSSSRLSVINSLAGGLPGIQRSTSCAGSVSVAGCNKKP